MYECTHTMYHDASYMYVVTIIFRVWCDTIIFLGSFRLFGKTLWENLFHMLCNYCLTKKCTHLDTLCTVLRFEIFKTQNSKIIHMYMYPWYIKCTTHYVSCDSMWPHIFLKDILLSHHKSSYNTIDLLIKLLHNVCCML